MKSLALEDRLIVTPNVGAHLTLLALGKGLVITPKEGAHLTLLALEKGLGVDEDSLNDGIEILVFEDDSSQIQQHLSSLLLHLQTLVQDGVTKTDPAER